MQPSGEQAYSEIVDLGCDNGGSVGLAVNIHCELEGYKYFINQNDIAIDMHDLDTTLMKNGWKSNAENTNVERYKQIMRGDQSGSVSYMHGNGKAYAYLSHYKRDEQTHTLAVEQLMKARKLPSDKSIVGVRVTETYWSCRGDALTHYPCLFPPSKPE